MKLRLNGNYYLYFNDFTITTILDSVASTFAFTLRWNPANLVHKELVRPLAFHKVEFFDEVTNKLYFTGLIVNHSFNSQSAPGMVKLSGYSLGGVLEDCTIDYKQYPLESINRTLTEIARRLLTGFGLKLIVKDNVKLECNKIYSKSVAEATSSVKVYLSSLAAQRNVVISHDYSGNIIFFRPDVKAVSKGSYNKDNTLNMGLEVDGQGMHSQITGVRQPSKKSVGLFDDESSGVSSVETVRNFLISAHRPYVDILSSGTETDTGNSAKNTFAAELKNIKWGFQIHRWDDIDVGDIVEVENDEVYLYRKTRLIIESIIKSESSTEKTMSVTLVLPESYTGDQPKNIFI